MRVVVLIWQSAEITSGGIEETNTGLLRSNELQIDEELPVAALLMKTV